MEAGRKNRAITPLLMALKYTKSRDMAKVHGNLMLCYKESGMYQKAIEHGKKALEYCPNSQVEHYTKAIAEIEAKLNVVIHAQKKLKKMGAL